MNKNVQNQQKVDPRPSQIEQHFLRPMPYRRDFSSMPRHRSLLDNENKDIEQQLEILNKQYKKQGARPSGQETHNLRLKVQAEHEAKYTVTCVKMALWNQSERILRLLRTPGLMPVPDASTTRDRQVEFINGLDLSRFPEADPNSPLYLSSASKDKEMGYAGHIDEPAENAIGPNQFFESICPELKNEFGYPFYTSITIVNGDRVGARVTGINKDFFAAYLRGQRRFHHDVVFYLPESRFYFYDPMAQQYVPTTEDKLRIVLSLTLQDRAWGLEMEDANMILNQFRVQCVFDAILAKAKTLMAVERGFFEGPEAKARFVVEDQLASTIASTVKAFIESKVAVDETHVLTITECVSQFEAFCRERGTLLPSHKEVKVVVQTKVREVYGKNLRKDLVVPGSKSVAGWKGLKLEERDRSIATSMSN